MQKNIRRYDKTEVVAAKLDQNINGILFGPEDRVLLMPHKAFKSMSR